MRWVSVEVCVDIQVVSSYWVNISIASLTILADVCDGGNSNDENLMVDFCYRVDRFSCYFAIYFTCFVENELKVDFGSMT